MGQQPGTYTSAHSQGSRQDVQITDGPGATRAFDDQILITDLVAAKALATPHTLAVAGEQEPLTYGELERRANRLAHYLISRGAGPERPAIICLPRSPNLVLSALAILKTGAAYVPLDPRWPPDRLKFVTRDSGAALLITQGTMAADIASDQCPVVDLQAGAEAIARSPGSPHPTGAVAQSLAYIIYTSGSTDEPKGVEITHRSVLNLIHWHRLTFRVTPADRATLVASPEFDASVWELWPYLAAGASLHVPDDSHRNDAERLRDWLISQAISITFVPTPLAELMMGLEWPVATPLRLMLTGADTLHHYPPAGLPFQLINNYGPTECAVVTTSGLVPAGGSAESLPSIGKPITNMRVILLGDNLKPVPAGAKGELCVSGEGLARGYRNRPELAAEKFITNPYSAEHGARL